MKNSASAAYRFVAKDGIVDCSEMFAEQDAKRMRYLNAVIAYNSLSKVIENYKKWPGYSEQLDKATEKMDKVKAELSDLGIAVG